MAGVMGAQKLKPGTACKHGHFVLPQPLLQTLIQSMWRTDPPPRNALAELLAGGGRFGAQLVGLPVAAVMCCTSPRCFVQRLIECGSVSWLLFMRPVIPQQDAGSLSGGRPLRNKWWVCNCIPSCIRKVGSQAQYVQCKLQSILWQARIYNCSFKLCVSSLGVGLAQ